MNITDTAWLAGIIDTDGSIIVGRSPKGSLKKWLVVYNTNTEIVERCRAIAGGCVTKNRPGYYAWRLSAQEATISVSEAAEPWSVLKWEQLMYLRELNEMCRLHGSYRPKDNLIERVRLLNRNPGRCLPNPCRPTDIKGNWAWLAGVIDGDGHISLSKRESGAYRIKIEVINTRGALLDLVLGTVGRGTVSWKPAKKHVRKACGTWGVGAQGLAALRAVLPYLVKQEQLRLLMRAAEINTERARVRRRVREEEMVLIYERLRELKRGTV